MECSLDLLMTANKPETALYSGQAFLDRKIKCLTTWMSVSHLAPVCLFRGGK